MLAQAKSHAATIDCVAIENGQLLRVDAISPHYNNCLELTGLDLSKPLAVTVFSADKTTSKLSVYGGSSSTTTQKLLDKVSDSDGIMSFSTNVHSGKSTIQLKLSTFNKATQNKSLTVFYTKDQSANIISIVIESKRSTVIKTPPGDGGYCNPETGICYEPRSVLLPASATAC